MASQHLIENEGLLSNRPMTNLAHQLGQAGKATVKS